MVTGVWVRGGKWTLKKGPQTLLEHVLVGVVSKVGLHLRWVRLHQARNRLPRVCVSVKSQPSDLELHRVRVRVASMSHEFVDEIVGEVPPGGFLQYGAVRGRVQHSVREPTDTHYVRCDVATLLRCWEDRLNAVTEFIHCCRDLVRPGPSHA